MLEEVVRERANQRIQQKNYAGVESANFFYETWIWLSFASLDLLLHVKKNCMMVLSK